MIRVAENVVTLQQLLVFLTAIAEIAGRVCAEEIVCAYLYEKRLRSERVQQVPPIEAKRSGTNQVLLGVVRGAGRIKVCTGHVLCVAGGNGRRRQSRIGASEQHSERATSRLTSRR